MCIQAGLLHAVCVKWHMLLLVLLLVLLLPLPLLLPPMRLAPG
jgi:hypothetical protein